MALSGSTFFFPTRVRALTADDALVQVYWNTMCSCFELVGEYSRSLWRLRTVLHAVNAVTYFPGQHLSDGKAQRSKFERRGYLPVRR